MSDVYQTPEAELVEAVKPGEYGSVENALKGNYNFNIKEVLTEAWEKTNGNKASIFGATICLTVISFVIAAISFSIFPQTGSSLSLGDLLNTVANALLTGPIFAATLLMGIKVSVNKKITINEIGKYWHKILPIFLIYMAIYFLIVLGIIALVLPGVYLMVSYMMAIQLLVEKDMGIWEALETSRKAITKKWFTMFFYLIILLVTIVVSAIPLLIGLIWTVPFMNIASGIIYRNMFGVEPSTLES